MKAFKIVLFISIWLCFSQRLKSEEYQEIPILPGDLIENLAEEHNLSVHEIIAANHPSKFIRVCRDRKEFVDEMTGQKFELCQKVTFWLKAGTEINIPVSRKKLESDYQKLAERREGLEKENKKLEKQNAELAAELAKLRAKQNEVVPQTKEASTLLKFVFVILGFCVLMFAAIAAIIVYLRKISQKIFQIGQFYKASELAQKETELAIEKHNYWERQKELARIMADLRQEKSSLVRERGTLERKKKELEEKETQLMAREIDLERVSIGFKNWVEKERLEIKEKEKNLNQRLLEAEERLNLANLGNETTLEVNETETLGQEKEKGWQEEKKPQGQECFEECSSLYGGNESQRDREPTEPELVAQVARKGKESKGLEKRQGRGAKKNQGNTDFL